MAEELFSLDKLDLDAVLCFVRYGHAYFTTQALENQWGDDWNDTPYECNAGVPYWDLEDPPRWRIYEIPFDHGCLQEPGEEYLNSPYSVEAINKGAAPWLRTGKWVEKQSVIIPAGTKLREFIPLVEMAGGKVYLPITSRREQCQS